MKLFKDIRPQFKKTAGKTPLGDNESMRGSEILAALYKQHDYLGSYEVNLRVDGEDKNMGFLYGVFLVSNPSNEPSQMSSNYPGQMQRPEQPKEDPQSSRIPVIVEENKLYSFDVFIDPAGSFAPLTKENLERAMFNTSNFKEAPKPKPTMSTSSSMNM